jgi:hypothetical protein
MAAMRNILPASTIPTVQSPPLHPVCVPLLVLSALVAVSTLAYAQDGIESMRDVPVQLSADTAPATVPTATQPADSSTTAEARIADQNTAPPRPQHTGLATLARDTVNDFKAFPRRESTWVILGVGGGLAALAHPVDDDVNAHLVSSGSADKIWKAGHIIGGPVIYVVPVALYVGGRYVLPKFTDDLSTTNKWSHLGLDLVRVEILEEAIVEGLKVSVRRTRPNGANFSFRPDMPRRHSRSLRCSSVTWDIDSHGRRS